MRVLSLSAAVVLVAALGWPAGARAATMIDGGAVGGQVWTATGSPYLVRGINGDLTVPAGQELRIEAGATVLFSDSHGPVLLRVDGTLNVNGTPAAPVTLRGELGGTAVVWNGIQSARSGSPQVRVAGAIIQNATWGVSIPSGAAQVDRTIFENCRYGLSVTSKQEYAFDSIVARNNQIGFECDYCGTVRITNMVAQGNTNHGVVLHGAGAVTIVNSTFEGNRDGVDVWPGPGPSSVDLVNTILSNNVAAIELDLTGGPAVLTVAHSTFWANRAANLRVKPSGSVGTQVITAGAAAPDGTGNVVADPKYVSATDLHLTAGSPCIDVGSATGAPDHDVDQAIRPVEGDGVPDTDGSTFDRGAYEFGATGAGDGGAGGGAGGSAGSEGGSVSGGNASGGNASGGNANGGNASGGNAMGGAGGRGGTVGGAGRSEGTGGAAGASSGNAAKNDGCGCDLGASSDPRAGLALLAFVFGLIRLRAQRKTR